MAERVLVAGATGGVGQLAVARLLDKGYIVRSLTRNAARAKQMFGDRVEIAVGDTRNPTTLPGATDGVDYILCCTGTTAFPSSRWEVDDSATANLVQQVQIWGSVILDADYRRVHAKNGPMQVDAEGVRHLVGAAPSTLRRFVFVSSCGVDHRDKPPYNILNAFGVLDAKHEGELAIQQSGLPYTVIRPGRLIDGPFTSYDLNTLLKATTDGKQGVVLGTGDTLTGQTSRIDVAAACVECLSHPVTENTIFELINQGPRPAELDWASLFAPLRSA